MKALLVAVVAIATFVTGPAPPSDAAGGCAWTSVSHFTNGQLVTELEMVCSFEGTSQQDAEPAFNSPIGEAACIGMAIQLGFDPQDFCSAAPTEPALTPGLVAQAFSRMPLPASDLVVQPPNGRTLVNFDTNFYTESAPLTRTLQLLGQRVDLDIWPSQFTWTFGDGHNLATASPGSPYPDLEITHSYTTKGHVTPAVDTTYSARFRVNNGPWQPVNGTVTIPGPTLTLDVVEATPTLVGYR